MDIVKDEEHLCGVYNGHCSCSQCLSVMIALCYTHTHAHTFLVVLVHVLSGSEGVVSRSWEGGRE